jgi:hypothetical protein
VIVVTMTAWCSSLMAGDDLGVNELHSGQCWSLVHVAGLRWSH